MKNLFQILLLLTSLFYVNTIFAETYNGPTKLSYRIEDDITIHGPATLNRVKAKSLLVNGTTQFDHLKVSQTAEFSGPVEGQFGDFDNCKIKGVAKVSEVKANRLSIMGSLNANRLKVSGDLEVAGQLNVQEAELGTLIVTPGDSDEILLNQTQVKRIVVKSSDKKSDRIQILKLMNNSIVAGDVVFESGHGKIETDQTSKVGGKITGAKN